MTDTILDMMENRRKAKNKYNIRYQHTDREMKKAKKKWKRYDTFNLHKKSQGGSRAIQTRKRMYLRRKVMLFLVS